MICYWSYQDGLILYILWHVLFISVHWFSWFYYILITELYINIYIRVEPWLTCHNYKEMGADAHLHPFRQPWTRPQLPGTPCSVVSSPFSSLFRPCCTFTLFFYIVSLFSPSSLLLLFPSPLIRHPRISSGSPLPAPSYLRTFFSIWCFLRPL